MTNPMRAVTTSILAVLLVIAACSSTAFAQDPTPLPPTLGTGNAAVYLTIRSEGAPDDLLVNAKTDVAERVELHNSTMDANGMAGMTPIEEGLVIPGSGRIQLDPGGAHVMLVDLRQDLRPGETFPITLTFANEGDVALTVTVATLPPPLNGFSVTSGTLIFTPPWALPAPMLTPAPTGSPVASPTAYAR